MDIENAVVNVNDNSIEVHEIRSRMEHSKNRSIDASGRLVLVAEPEVGYSEAIKIYLHLSIPAIVGLIVRRVVEIMNYLVVGRLEDPDMISGVGLGIITCNVTCFSIGVGLAGGIETLSSQAFGNKNNYLAGCYFSRAQVILTILFVPQAYLLYNATTILEWIGEPASSAKYAGDYINIVAPGLFLFCQTELLRRFLGTQGVFYLILKFQLITTTLHPLWIYIFVYYYEGGMTGLAIATTVTYSLTFVISYGYISLNQSVIKPNSWSFINKDSFIGLVEYMKYGVPSMLMKILEFWCSECLVLMSGLLGTEQLGASIILINVVSLLYMIPLGLSFSTSSLVGNNLGALKPGNAKMYTNISVYTSLILSVVTAIFILLFKREIAYIFTSHEEIAGLVIDMLPIVTVVLCGNYIQGITSGPIRAMGQQNLGTLFSIVGYWFISIPLAYLLAFLLDYGLIGIWVSLPIGLLLLSAAFLYMIYTTDFEELSQEVVERMERDKQKIEDYQKLEDIREQELSDSLIK